MNDKGKPVLSPQERAYVEREFQKQLDLTLAEMQAEFIASIGSEPGPMAEAIKSLKASGSIKFASKTSNDMTVHLHLNVSRDVWVAAAEGIRREMGQN